MSLLVELTTAINTRTPKRKYFIKMLTFYLPNNDSKKFSFIIM